MEKIVYSHKYFLDDGSVNRVQVIRDGKQMFQRHATLFKKKGNMQQHWSVHY